MLVHSIESYSRRASHHPQQSLVVHGIEQVSRGVRLASPIIPYRAMRKVVIDFLRVDDAAFAHEFQHELSSLSAPARPRQSAFRGHTAIRTGMHERLNLCG